MEGIVRFLRRLWRLVHEAAERDGGDSTVDSPLARKAHATIAKVTDDIERRLSYNTAISAIMESRTSCRAMRLIPRRGSPPRPP